MMAIQTLITETYTHVSNLKDMYIIVIVTHLSETETQFGNLKRMHIIRMHTHISSSHRHLTSFIGVFAEIISNECIILTSFINMFVARVIGKVWPLNYRTVITEETRDMCPFTLLTSCIFIFFNYHSSNNLYRDLLAQDDTTFMSRGMVRTLLPNNWVVSDVSIKISIFYLKKIYLLFSHIFFIRLFSHTYISLYGRFLTMSQASWLCNRRHDLVGK
jgi:hypothetical protein